VIDALTGDAGSELPLNTPQRNMQRGMATRVDASRSVFCRVNPANCNPL